MKKRSVIELTIWIIIFCIVIGAIRIWRYEKHLKTRQYQTFIPDADGLMIGSPVKYGGVQIGYIDNLKLLSDNVYVKFILTQKDFELPVGTIATVEFSGMGGSKSLELYPPTKESLASKKIIAVKNTRRLDQAVNLLGDMYIKIDSIFTRLSYFADETDLAEGGQNVDIDKFNANINNFNNWTNKMRNKKNGKTKN